MWWLVFAPAVVVVTLVSATEVKGPWWRDAVYYRIIVDSFKDSNGDGLGDLNGLLQQISYPQALGVDAVILSPLSSKSTDCRQPGVIDLTDLDTRYGSITDFTAVLEKAKQLEIKVVLTLPIKTVSTISDWFNKSAKGVTGFEDFILWKNKNDSNEKETSTWTSISETKAFASTNNEALLNLCSEAVTAALSEALCCWIRRGVSGVLINPDFPSDASCSEKVIRKLATAAVSCARANNLENPAILAESSYSLEWSSKYVYSDNTANSLISTTLSSPKRSTTAEIASYMYSALIYAPTDSFPTWTSTATNESLTATRYGSDMVDAINLLALTLPGACIIHQGDELGSADTLLELMSSKETCWPSTPTSHATPFAWDSNATGGFTTGNPWLPLPPNFRYANAKGQFNIEDSHVGVFKMAVAIRKTAANGPQFEIKRFGEILTVLRWGRMGMLLLVVNLGQGLAEISLNKIYGLPSEMVVATSSSGSSTTIGANLNVEKSMKLISSEAILLVGEARLCGGLGPVDKITNKIQEGWQRINKYFSR